MTTTYPVYLGPRIQYNDDGTIVITASAESGTLNTASQGDLNIINGEGDLTIAMTGTFSANQVVYAILFFPVAYDFSGAYGLMKRAVAEGVYGTVKTVQGSNDTTNGFDGTWEVATVGTPIEENAQLFDAWRNDVVSVSFVSGPYATLKISFWAAGIDDYRGIYYCHVYGTQNPTPTAEADFPILFLDPDDSNNEFTEPIDFGGLPTGETATPKSFKIKNNSALTASTIVIAVDDDAVPAFEISETIGSGYTSSIALASLAAGASSATYYARAVAPASPTALKPTAATVKVTVTSWA